jgi:gamma-glutamyltranspeptidase/glutathione hydrolase
MFTTRPELSGTFGMVASTHWLASAAGMAVLERGGNAFDAAAAAGFVLQVVEPHLNGPGGDMPALLYDRGQDRIRVLCGQGPAPAAATIERYRSEGLDLVPGTGLLATVIPGAFDAWLLLLRDHGTLPLPDVLSYAIGYADGGYPLVPLICATIDRVADIFRVNWPTSGAVYLVRGDVPVPGTVFCNPALARTYQRLVAESEAAGGSREDRIEAARRTWSEGFVAEAVDRFCRSTKVLDSSGEAHGGVLTGDDMAAWRASFEAPLTYDYHGYTVCKTGPWAQGPVLLQQLALLKGFDLDDMDPRGANFVHVVTECSKLAFADREVFYGDPVFVEIPMETLLSDDYARQRRQLVDERASLEFRPGDLPPYGQAIDYEAYASETRVAEIIPSALGSGEPTVQTGDTTRGDTCHVDVVDRHGNMISATPSGGWLQSSPVIPDLGFCLNSRGQMFWLEESHPAALVPGKRPRSTLSANLVLRDGTPYMVFGTPGGDRQDQWNLVFFLRHMHHGMNLQQAIDAPMFHNDHMPSSFWPRAASPGHLAIEERFAPAVREELTRRGHRVDAVDGWSLGRLSAVTRDSELLKAAANPRFMQGYAVGR